MKTYKEKLSDPRWQKKRLEVFSNSNFSCDLCLDEKSELHVHHKEYIKDKDIWDYDDSNFQSLCFACHDVVGKSKNEIISCVKNDKYIFSINSMFIVSLYSIVNKNTIYHFSFHAKEISQIKDLLNNIQLINFLITN